VLGAELFIAATSDDTNSMVETTVSDISAVSDLDDYPGTAETLDSFPVWKWFLAPLVGLITIGIMLYKNRDELRGGGS
jgi:hypothetical protein